MLRGEYFADAAALKLLPSLNFRYCVRKRQTIPVVGINCVLPPPLASLLINNLFHACYSNLCKQYILMF